jgi:ribosomal protein S18 acetylase RimI-like enzyme
MQNIMIRKALIQDKTVLLQLEQAIIDAERPYNQTIKLKGASYYDLDNLLQDASSNLMVAESNGRIIGTGYAQIRVSKQALEHVKHSYLGFMYVVPEYRGLGINKQILDTLIKWSKTQEVSDFYLDVYNENDAAVNAYKKVGFVKTLVEMKLNINSD